LGSAKDATIPCWGLSEVRGFTFDLRDILENLVCGYDHLKISGEDYYACWDIIYETFLFSRLQCNVDTLNLGKE